MAISDDIARRGLEEARRELEARTNMNRSTVGSTLGSDQAKSTTQREPPNIASARVIDQIRHTMELTAEQLAEARAEQLYWTERVRDLEAVDECTAQLYNKLNADTGRGIDASPLATAQRNSR